jgi:DNA-binding IclR family transcriptional regulator
MIHSRNFIKIIKHKNSLEKYSAPALEKGLDILEFLVDFPEGLSKVDIAKGLGRSLNEIFRMISVLERRGYILCDPETERYFLSLKLFSIANRYQPARMLVKKAHPMMMQLTQATDQSCHLCIFHNGKILIIAQIDAPFNHSYNVKLGAEINVFSTSSGMILLAYQTEETRNTMIDQCQDAQDLNKNQLALKLKNIRRMGFEEVESYMVKGVYNLSAPVLDPNGRALAALTIPFLAKLNSTRIERKRARGYLVEVAQELSNSIGGTEHLENS